MQRSTDRVLTTHVGSLARPEPLLDTMREKEHGRPYDHDLFARQVTEAVADVVARQREAGIDVVTDGEMGKVSFATYIQRRLDGFAPDSGERLLPPSWQVEIDAFPEYYEGYLGKYTKTVAPMQSIACVGPVRYTGHDELQTDLANLHKALAGHRLAEDGTGPIVLVATELASNALRHGLPPAVVRLLTADGQFFLEVADRDLASVPKLAEAHPAVGGGRGLHIARSLSLEVCWYATEQFKHVWASFPNPAAPRTDP